MLFYFRICNFNAKHAKLLDIVSHHKYEFYAKLKLSAQYNLNCVESAVKL